MILPQKFVLRKSLIFSIYKRILKDTSKYIIFLTLISNY